LEISDLNERAAFLEKACSAHPGLRARIEALINANAEADTLFATPCAALDNEPGKSQDYITQIGHYRLVSRMGEGGCGVVYLAAQQGPVRRMVALKVIRLGMDTEQVIKRFEVERQALALMEHPYIARVLDAGATDNGRPFFVMERVAGVRITEYCAQQRLTIPARLELFIKVCQGVQHAHEKGVIHRDIKSSNVLVTEVDGKPEPKIIDFGIAKATDNRLTEQTLHTSVQGALIGSPSHMSPEHACNGGVDVDTRSDIYSLGVLLSELLVGQAPFELCDWTRLDAEQIRLIVQTREARRPSLVLGDLSAEQLVDLGTQRAISPAKLQTLLKGELDWIVLKALASERDRRYATAAALAADIQRYLAHEVIEARPPSSFYHFSKFVQRNQGPAIAVSMVLVSLMAGLWVSIHLYVREQGALKTQVELRRETEKARANEEILRRRAEAGERIANAAVQIWYQRLPEADHLVAELPTENVQPSLESALVFRTLGSWHARSGRWSQAARYLGAFASSITEIDPSDQDWVSGNLIPAAAAIVESGQSEDYERFRKLLLRRFAATRNIVVAEQVMKSCLLTPASPETLSGLEPLAVIVEQSCNGPDIPEDAYMRAWRCFVLGLFQYRKGNYTETAHWLDRSLATPNTNDAREAAVRLMRAMVYSRHGNNNQAAAEIRRADELLNLHKGDTSIPAPETTMPIFHGYWFDWVINQTLRRELSTRDPVMTNSAK